MINNNYPKDSFKIRLLKILPYTLLNTKNEEIQNNCLLIKELLILKNVTHYPNGYNILKVEDFYLSKAYNFISDGVYFPIKTYNKLYMNKIY
jgi:hypothetical protein